MLKKSTGKKLGFGFVFMIFMFLGVTASAQNDCSSIQCDCENIPDSDKDLGLIALCKYYEKELKKRCENGEKNLKCKENAKGPKAWTKDKASGNDKEEAKPFDDVDISHINNVNSIKYCKQLMTYVKKKGYFFGNVRVPGNLYNKGYFKEAWAYDIDDVIYVIVVISKEKRDGYSYKLSVQSNNYGEYQHDVYCGIKRSNWKAFSAPCNGCDYDKRYTELIKKFECDCL